MMGSQFRTPLKHLINIIYEVLINRIEEVLINKAFRHVETLFVQGNQVRTDQNKPPFLVSTNLITLAE